MREPCGDVATRLYVNNTCATRSIKVLSCSPPESLNQRWILHSLQSSRKSDGLAEGSGTAEKKIPPSGEQHAGPTPTRVESTPRREEKSPGKREKEGRRRTEKGEEEEEGVQYPHAQASLAKRFDSSPNQKRRRVLLPLRLNVLVPFSSTSLGSI